MNQRKQRKANSEFRRENYNSAVSNDHFRQADEHARVREANEARIKQLEEIEQRMVNDLQNTLQRKNAAMNKLAEKSKGLKKVMQPRMAYKYAPRDTSSSNLMQMKAQSSYAVFNSGAQGASIHKRRTLSISSGANGSPAAGPSSGKQGMMFNDTSATVINSGE